MDTERCEPAGPWHAFDGRRSPYTRPDKGPTRGESHHLARADAQPRVHAGLDEEGEMRVGTPPPIRHQPITGGYQRVHLLPLGEIMGEEGRDDQLQEPTGARREEPQEVGHGKAAPRPLRRRLAERVLEGRGIGQRAARALDEHGPMTMPPPVVHGKSLHGTADAL
jgi:hypothetical protein